MLPSFFRRVCQTKTIAPWKSIYIPPIRSSNIFVKNSFPLFPTSSAHCFHTQQPLYDGGIFSKFSNKLSNTFNSLFKKNQLTKRDVEFVMEQVKFALIDADVSLPVAKEFVKQLTEECIGKQVQDIPKPAFIYSKVLQKLTDLLDGSFVSIKPNKFVSELEFLPELKLEQQLQALLSQKQTSTPSNEEMPSVATQMVLISGIQGSGKTTTCAKIAYRLAKLYHKKVLTVSLDVRRPAAQEQLQIMSTKAGVDCFTLPQSKDPLEIATEAMKHATTNGYQVVLMDSAGRMAIDKELMQELRQVEELIHPKEILLVADSMLGQDAIQIAKQFHDQLGLTGICLTRVDGDSRGGAAISMRAITGVPIKFIGTGEQIEDLEPFQAKTIAARILGSGDIGALAQEYMSKMAMMQDSKSSSSPLENLKKTAMDMVSGKFSFESYLNILKSMASMGSVSRMASFIPKEMLDLATNGQADKINQMDQQFNVKEMYEKHNAIISQMQPDEKVNPFILKASSARRVRLAKAANVEIADINALLKMYDKFQSNYGKQKSGGGMLSGGMLSSLFGKK